MRRLIRNGCCLALWLSCSTVAMAEPLEPGAAKALLGDFLNSTRSYYAEFRQTLIDERGVQLEDGDGELWLQRPGRFRWRYDAPWPRLLVAGDGVVWLYDEELEQVTVRPLGTELEQTPAGLLVSDIVILDRYLISGETAAGSSRITLKPIDGGGDFAQVTLVLVAGQLHGLMLNDSFGQITTIEFSAISMNQPIQPDLFTFEPPAGADVVDERPVVN